jgi:hypothetical protein
MSSGRIPSVPTEAPWSVTSRIVRCGAAALVLIAAAGCGQEVAAPSTPVWVSHATLTGTVFLSDATVVPGARVTLAQISGDASFARYGADTVTSDAAGRFTLTVRRDGGTSSTVAPPRSVGVRLVAKNATGGVIGESVGFTQFGAIGEPAPVNPRNIVAP